MGEDLNIINYAKLDSQHYEAPARLKQHIVETAEEYGFTVDIVDMDFKGITAPTGDHLEVDPGYVEDNGITYLYPELMEEKITARISFLRGTYEDPHFGFRESQEARQLSDTLQSKRQELRDQKFQNYRLSEKDEVIPAEIGIEQNKELTERIERLDERISLISNGGASQANLHMVDDQMKRGKDPVRVIAASSYNPARFGESREDLEGFYNEHFRMFPWLHPDARDAVIDEVEAINQKLRERAENFEL